MQIWRFHSSYKLLLLTLSHRWELNARLPTTAALFFCSNLSWNRLWHWEDLYADDLIIIAESLEECVRRLLTWKEAMEKKGLRVNAGKTKIMICSMGLELLQSSGEFPCPVCRTGGQQQHLLQWLQALGAQEMHWTSFWRREDFDGMDMWNAPVVQPRQPLTYRLMESVGLGGPKWHGSSWQRGIAESGSSRLSTLMIDVPGDLVWDLPCVQQASYLEGGPLMWMLPLYLHVNQKSDYDIWYEMYLPWSFAPPFASRLAVTNFWQKDVQCTG